MKDLFKALPILEKLKTKKYERIKSRARISALFEKFYAYDPHIKIPYPNLFADTIIRERFGENWDFSDIMIVMEILYIIENQENALIADQTMEERKRAVHKRMMQIPGEARIKYREALYEMFIALKKNSNQLVLGILEQARTILEEKADIPSGK